MVASSGTGRGSRSRNNARGGSSGRGRGRGRGRGASEASDAAVAARRKARKAATHQKSVAQLEDKLEAEASFFWECVQQRRRGIDIRGCSGTERRERSASQLFGSQGERGINFDDYDRIPVTRSGDGASEAEVPPLGDDFFPSAATPGMTPLPHFALANLLGEDRMRLGSPTPIQRHCVPLALTSCDLM